MASISVSGSPVYTITVQNGDGAVGINLAVSKNDLGVDMDALAEAVRGLLLADVTDPTASYTDKTEASASVLFPT